MYFITEVFAACWTEFKWKASFQATSEPAEPKSDDDGAFNSDDDFDSIDQADKDEKKPEEVNHILI